MVFVQGGKFIMGDNNRYDKEKPEHEVELSSFFIGKFQVTQELYEKVTGENPSSFKGKNRPVEQISWYDSIKFCQKLNDIFVEPRRGVALQQPITGNDDNAKLDLTKTGFRLPTEAEWEYAASTPLSNRYTAEPHRGVAPPQRHKYAGSNNIQQVAWFRENSNETKPVGLKLPNSLGIYDMSGNIWEWCWDWYDEKFYEKSGMKNPVNLSKGSGRVIRGGSRFNGADGCRTASRYGVPDREWHSGGFRLVLAF